VPYAEVVLSTPFESAVPPADALTNALRQIARWFCISVGARGVAIYGSKGLVYESEQCTGTPWPDHAAAEADRPRAIGPFVIAPMYAHGQRVGSFIALTLSAVFARQWLHEAAHAAEVVSVILAANTTADAGDCR
jgi:hypothetical protein